MARMRVALTVRGGSAGDLEEALRNDSRWAAAVGKGLTSVEVLADPDEPSNAVVATLWRDIESAKSFQERLGDEIVSGDVAVQAAGPFEYLVHPIRF